MNISHDGATVHFKTAPKELFEAEKSGAKSNTVCIIDNDEYEMLNTHTPKEIIIQYQEEIFLRTLTNLYFAKLFGKVIVIFSWAHKEPRSKVHITSPDQPSSFEKTLPFEQEAHSVGLQQEAESSLNERFAAITISNGTLALIQSIAHGRTINMVINELYEEYMCTRAKERGPLHD